MTVLRLGAAPGAFIEPALALCDAVTLARRPDGAFAEVAAADVDRLVRALALGGVAAGGCATELSAPAGAHPAVGRDLAPLRSVALDLDVVRLRRLTLGEATRRVLARRWPLRRGPSRAARDRCRALLRGEDVAFLWVRRAWATRSALRGPEARAALKPVVFDRGALERDVRGGIAFARDGVLARWLL